MIYLKKHTHIHYLNANRNLIFNPFFPLFANKRKYRKMNLILNLFLAGKERSNRRTVKRFWCWCAYNHFFCIISDASPRQSFVSELIVSHTNIKLKCVLMIFSNSEWWQQRIYCIPSPEKCARSLKFSFLRSVFLNMQ